MSRFSRLLVLTIMVLSVCAPVIADDLNPPPWRGQPGTTFQKWEFMTPNPSPLPDAMNNPYGIPQTMVLPGFQQVWWPELKGRMGVWPLSGSIETTIPNSPIANPWKDVWVQLTWSPQVPGGVVMVEERRFGGIFTEISRMPLGGEWFHSTYHFRIYPNPDWETIFIWGSVDVDELVIDTQCVPEPSSLMVLAGSLFGLAGFIARRRR